MRSARQTATRFVVLVTLLICCGRSVACADPEFVFGLDNVCSAKNERGCVSLGSPWHAPALQKAMPGYEITYSRECDGACFLVQTKEGNLEIHQKDGKVDFFRSLGGAMDFQGNRMGGRLRDALGSTAYCMSGMNFVCSVEKTSPLRYVVGGCEFKIQTDENAELQDDEKANIPECAVIDGLELSASWEENKSQD